MLEFETLVYLDVQKTGSTFVTRFFRRFVASPEIAYRQGWPRTQRKEGALHVISCRHPFDHYRSLYSYGCEGKGVFMKQLKAAGLASLYDGTTEGFARWLELTLSPHAADHPLRELFGLRTFRFLRLAIPQCRKSLRQAKTKQDVKEHLARLGMMDVLLKREALNEDLLRLVTGEHAHLFKDRDGVPAYLAETPKVNASKDLRIDPFALPSNTLSALRDREWLLFDVLGYD